MDLENELIGYLMTLSNLEDVLQEFPHFETDQLVVSDSNGYEIAWWMEVFFNRPLGRTVIELNNLKLKIAKLEYLRTR